MKSPFLLIVSLLFTISTVQAQEFAALNELQPPPAFDLIHDQSVISDEHAQIHVIWAAPGFRKERQGALVYEQALVLEGRARISFAKKAQEVSPGTFVTIPANTPHTVEVLGEEKLKMLVIQRKPDA